MFYSNTNIQFEAFFLFEETSFACFCVFIHIKEWNYIVTFTHNFFFKRFSSQIYMLLHFNDLSSSIFLLNFAPACKQKSKNPEMEYSSTIKRKSINSSRKRQIHISLYIYHELNSCSKFQSICNLQAINTTISASSLGKFAKGTTKANLWILSIKETACV